MGVTGSGSLNSAGFSGSLSCGYLPKHTHLTYQGLFNELRYNVGPKTDKVLDLHHGYARFQFTESKFDSEIHDYLALFLKGRSDGQPRQKTRRLNSIICLDISGSMNMPLGSSNNKHQSRISLCKQAIKMFISKLQPQDSIGMTTFDDKAHLIFSPILKKHIQPDIYGRLDQIKAIGQNTLLDGFNLSKSMLLQQMKKQQKPNDWENRVVILSDVCDDSINHGIEAIKAAASEENVHLSIIGISTQFNSFSCQALKDTEGFNYFCAVTEEDVLKYMFQTFDYTFFPSASQIQISLQSSDISKIEVYGTPDSEAEKQVPYQQQTTTQGSNFLVTRIKSCFPSQIEIDKEVVFTVGGMILVKIYRKQKGSSFKGKVRLVYKDLQKKSYDQMYELDYQFHPEEQFVSDQLLREAIAGFIYTSEMKTILRASEHKEQKQIYQTYFEMLKNLEGLCPKRKYEDYIKIKEIIAKYNPQYSEINRQQSAKETPLERVK